MTTSQQKLTADDEPNQYSNILANSDDGGEQTSMASTSTASKVTITSKDTSAIKTTPTNRVKSVAEDMASKKRDVIIIGAGLSGK